MKEWVGGEYDDNKNGGGHTTVAKKTRGEYPLPSPVVISFDEL